MAFTPNLDKLTKRELDMVVSAAKVYVEYRQRHRDAAQGVKDNPGHERWVRQRNNEAHRMWGAETALWRMCDALIDVQSPRRPAGYSDPEWASAVRDAWANAIIDAVTRVNLTRTTPRRSIETASIISWDRLDRANRLLRSAENAYLESVAWQRPDVDERKEHRDALAKIRNAAHDYYIWCVSHAARRDQSSAN